MCSVIILRRPGHAWPVLIAANRDERPSRAWRPPARHWPERPEVTAGLDEEAGGTWQGVNDHGVTAAILNRVGTLGPAAGKRSRGEIVLEALDHADAREAAAALSDLNPDAYRPFNLLIADNRDAFWLRHAGDGRIGATRVGEGVSMLTAHDLNDTASPRVRRYLPLFRQADMPDPDAGDWSAWAALLGATDTDSGNATDAMFIRTDRDYGTICTSLIALPEPGDRRPIWRFTDDMPTSAPFRAVDLPPARADIADL
ncbi:NRDE family protein [Marinivivus vitaminiproducens]|uniref:NRDE family protein n=1 Tax=Marinivivus vitaminiproducens TaxID=3035935 RepID=UPI0027A205C7|nr:NRDE family protein [Geminicoccaceae bacterium SCSIO 64248]